MRTTLIPDGEEWTFSQRQVIGAPDGDLTGESGIEPVEALIDAVRVGSQVWPRYSVRLVLDDEDVARIQAGERVVWLSLLASIPPFVVSMHRPEGAIPFPLRTVVPEEPGKDEFDG